MKEEDIIGEIEKLAAIKSFRGEEIPAIIEQFGYEPIIDFLRHLPIMKPETAAGELVQSLATDLLDKKMLKELTVKKGFADFAFEEDIDNPVVIELKTLFHRAGEKFVQEKYILAHNKTQVQKYLTDNQYVILTNLNDCYLFNREAMVDYEPFIHLSFAEFLRRFITTDNLWDTARRLEDDRVKPDLEKVFFDDLKNWYEELQVIEFDESDGYTKEESIVLLLNKIIFIKTLEDHALIPFKYLEDLFTSLWAKWEIKGEEKFFRYFFTEIENWFWDFYDTELFNTSFYDKLIKTRENLRRFKTAFEKVMGFGVWERTFGKGMIHYNYRKIDEDVFGKAYETFLASRRKDEGIYYTPKAITQYMAKRLVDTLFGPLVNKIIAKIDENKFDDAYELLLQLRNIRIADTCSGSGSFLIKVLREIYAQYILMVKKTSYYSEYDDQNRNGTLFVEDRPRFIADGIAFRKKCFFDDLRRMVASIVLNHLFAIDIDDRALEIAKTNIWKEAVKLNPSIFHFRKLFRDINHILPNLSLNFINADGLYDLPLPDLVNELSANYKGDIIRLHEIRGAYLKDPYNPEVLDEAIIIKSTIRTKLEEQFALDRTPTLMPLEFFFLFFDERGNALPHKQWGFNGIISNPPWEAIKPVKKEFSKVDKLEMDILHFDEWFEKKIKSDEAFKTDWIAYTDFYRKYNKFLNARYMHQGGGDPNFYKLFIERDLELIREEGYINILVPSGFQTDYGCGDLRKMIFEDFDLKELSSFENRGYQQISDGKAENIRLFPDVDSRFKFSVVYVKRDHALPFHCFDARFYLHHPDDLRNEPIEYDVEMVKRFSPDNFSIMEFRGQNDYELCKKIRGKHKTLGESELQFRSEFHMTNDSHLYHREKKRDFLPLYEGKMIHQYISDYAPKNFYVDKQEGEKDLLDSAMFRVKRKFDLTEAEVKPIAEKPLLLDYQNYRLVYRAIARSTDERTIISSIIPKNIFIGHSMNHLVNYGWEKKGEEIQQVSVPFEQQIILLALLNSITLNYYMRNKVSANLTMNFMYELPTPAAKKKQQAAIVELAFQLLWHFNEHELYEDLRKELNLEPKEKIDPIETRARLEILIARDLYGLSKEDWDYLTSTFVYGGESVTKKELDEVIEKSKTIY